MCVGKYAEIRIIGLNVKLRLCFDKQRKICSETHNMYLMLHMSFIQGSLANFMISAIFPISTQDRDKFTYYYSWIFMKRRDAIPHSEISTKIDI